MKNLRSGISVVTVFVFSFAVQAQSTDLIIKALGEANVEGILAFVRSDLDICIFDQEANYARQDAAGVLDSFFRDHPIKDIHVEHRGSSGYVIARLTTDHTVLRAYIYTHQSSDSLLLDEIRIAKTE